MTAPCCPPGSHGAIPADDVRTLSGWWQEQADLDCYFSGVSEKPSNIILVFPDVFGASSGRHRRICDDIARALDSSLVCMPDLFHGDPICPDFAIPNFWSRLRFNMHLPRMMYRIRYRFGWGQVGPEIQRLTASLREQNPSAFVYCCGFCYGGYLAVKASASCAFRGAVAFHPSLIIGKMQCSPHSQSDVELGKEVRCPQLMVPAGNDEGTVKPDGAFMKVVAESYPLSKSVPYEAMAHGWMTRGSDDTVLVQSAGAETVRQSQVSALEVAVEFFRGLAP
mmetsp:Transcript_37843/g.70593  ORF Transcript_37843/g.70593 Transcript_37843/m.70593 type:complete len:280 (+) Transcript_37843:67-906(+)